jgi:hypothetical protein
MSIKNILSLMIAMQMGFGSLAWGDMYSKAATKVAKEFEELGMKKATLKSYRAKDVNGKTFEGLVISGGKYDGKIVVGGDLKKERLKQWKSIKDAVLLQARNRKNIVHGLMGGSPPMKDVLVKLGPETLSFFVALGTIQYAKMIFDPGMNPLGTYQQVESQTHPLTHVSFGAFMYANGAVVPILQTILKPTNFLHKYISYMGMSAGMLTSDAIHEASAVMDGKLEKCVADLDAQVNNFEEIASSCDKAFETWAEYPLDFIMSLVPSVASLITSFIVAQRIEKSAQNILIKFGFKHLIRSIPLVGPSTIALDVARWGVHTAINILPFTVASELVGEPVAHGMKTFTSAANMDEIQRDVMFDLTRASASGWDEVTSKKATESVYKTSMLFKQWRSLNFEKIQATYSSWLAKVGKLSSQYNLTEFIYDQFLTMTEPDAKRTSFQFLMRRPAPLYGITQLVEEGRNGDSEYENPRNVMLRQLQQIVKVTSQFNEEFVKLRNDKFDLSTLGDSGFGPAFSKFAQDSWAASTKGFNLDNGGNLSGEESKFVTAMWENSQKLNQLAQKALTLTSVSNVEGFFSACIEIGKIFDQINSQTGYKSYYPGLHPGSVDINFERSLRASGSREKIALERARIQFRKFFRSQFGNPFPINQPGGLFFAALEDRNEVQSNSLALKNLNNVNDMVTFQPAQKVFTDMFFGPHVSSRDEIFKAHSINLGIVNFGQDISSMDPPRLMQNKPNVTLLHQEAMKLGKEPGYPTLFNTPVLVGKNKFNNFYEYALQSWQEAFSFKTSKELKEFWKNSILPGYQAAWAELQPFYENFIRNMYTQIRSDDKSILNRGPLHNGNLAEIELEKKLYLVMFGEILRSLKIDSSAYAPKVDFVKLSPSLLQKKYVESGPFVRTFEASGDRVQILDSLNQNKSLVLFDHFKQAPDSKYAGWNEEFPGQNLHVQNMISSYFNQMVHFIDSVKIEKNESAYRQAVVTSPFTNKEIISKRDEIQAKLLAWKDLTQEPIPGVAAQLKLKEQKLRAYQLSLTALRMLVGELATYALMGNELSFYRSDSNPGRAGVKDPECINETAGTRMGSNGTSTAQFNKKCSGGSSGTNSELNK